MLVNQIADKYAIDGTKIHLHPDKISHWKYGNKRTLFPIYLEVSPVGHCNHRCTFCAVDYIGYRNRSLDAARWTEIAADLAQNQVRSIMFAGEGEPLLHPKIGEMALATKAAGLDVAFTTNGVALVGKNVDPILEASSWLKISLNAGDKVTYAKIHQTKESDWDRVWSNLQSAVARRSIHPTIGVQCVILPDNITSLEGLLRKAQDTGLDYAVLKPYSQHKKSLTRTYEQITYDDKIQTLEEIASKYATKDFQVICRTNAMHAAEEETQPYTTCHSTPFLWAYVMATGDVYGCSAYLLDERFRYGNIHDQLFSGIWLSDKRRAAIEFVQKELCISECRKNCRMDKVNRYLNEVALGGAHKNFI